MNKIYRIVFNQATQTWTAVAENARAKGKSGRTTVGSSKLSKLMGVSAITAAALLSAQAMAEDTYFHVNNGTNGGTGDATTNLGGITEAAGATGQNSVTAGINAKALGVNGVAVGNNAIASNGQGVSVGANSHALGSNSTVVGSGAQAGFSSTAIGTNSNANSWSTALGISSNAAGRGAVAIGNGPTATGNDSLAIGFIANASGDNAQAIGRRSVVTGNYATAIGSWTKADVSQGVALGSFSEATRSGLTGSTVAATSDAVAANNQVYTLATASDADKQRIQATVKNSTGYILEDQYFGAVSLGVNRPGYQTTRQITNLAAGSEDTDAVNVAQLKAVANQVEMVANRTNYFHVNTGDENQAVGNADTNEGTVDAKGGAAGLYSLAAGMSAKADGQMAIAIGTGANAVDSSAIAIGEQAGTKTGVANRTIMIGSYAGAESSTTDSVLVGSHSAYNRTGSGGLIAIGNGAGSYHMSTTENPGFPEVLAYTTAIGNATAINATGSYNDYVGTQAGYYRHGDQNVSMGYLAGAAQASYSAVDITGIRTGAMGHDNVFFGTYSGLGLNGNDNIAIGQMSNAAWKFDENNKTGSMNDESIKVAYVEDTIAIGQQSTAQKNTAIAIGKDAKAAVAEGDVALGAGSVTRAVTPTSFATINGVTYGTFAGTAPTSAVSVGAVGKERQIQNVAAGQISATSTDAINGSQLYAVADKLTADIKAADTNTVTTVTAGKNIKVENIGTPDAPNYRVATADEVAFDKVTVGPVVISKDTGIDAGNTKITNVATGVADTDAVNVKQLNDAITNINTNISAARTEVAAGDNVTVETGAGENGQTVYTVSAKDTSASVSAGSSAVSVTKGTTGKVGTTDVTDYAVDLSQATKDDIQKGVDANTAVNNKGLTFTGDSGSTDVQKLGSTVGVKGDGNITTSASGSQVNVSLNKNLDLGDDGSITTGNTVVNNHGISITNGANQTVSLTNNGLNNGGNRITNVAPGVDATDAVNVSQLTNATNSIYSRIDDLDKDYRAGVAGNAAMMNIPQVTRPGANLLGIGLGHHKGESAVAVGFSSSSDNEQLIFKMSGSANTQGDFTIGSGLGWQW